MTLRHHTKPRWASPAPVLLLEERTGIEVRGRQNGALGRIFNFWVTACQSEGKGDDGGWDWTSLSPDFGFTFWIVWFFWGVKRIKWGKTPTLLGVFFLRGIRNRQISAIRTIPFLGKPYWGEKVFFFSLKNLVPDSRDGGNFESWPNLLQQKLWFSKRIRENGNPRTLVMSLKGGSIYGNCARGRLAQDSCETLPISLHSTSV